jgi:hypothetical protein
MSEIKENLSRMHEITHPKQEPKMTLKSVFKIEKRKDKKNKKQKNKKQK